MKLNKLLGLAVAVAAVSSLSAAIDADIQSKNGLALKLYAQVLKGRAGAPHHVALADPIAYDTEKLVESVGIARSAPYVIVELPKAKAKVKAYLDACMFGHANIGDQFLTAVVGGVGQPANTTYGAFITAFDAAFDIAVTAATINEAGPANAKLGTLLNAQERIDAKIQALITPWLDGLAVGGANIARANCQQDGAAAHGLLLGDAPADDTVESLRNGILAAIIIH